MTSIRRWLLLTFCFALAAGSLAQPPDSLHKPVRVGLVFSGGGAKGLAYIGMLKVLEEAGIQVDYIGGTSMGAIIGGLYASGWSAQQLDSLVHTTDLWQIIQEDMPRGAKPFFEKVYGEKYALTFALEGMSVALPAGLSNGQQVYDLLYRWTEHVNHVQDFYLLPIPFFCIATDAVNGKEVLLDCGSLPLAMRASGALPGLLAPVVVNGRLLTDGGLVNNFPAREVRERGMDYVIGLNVESSLFEQSELKSLERLIMQISLYQSDLRSKAQLEHCDVLIQPDMSGYGVTSFEALDSLIALGERTARLHWDQLVEIGKRQRAAGRQLRRKLTPPPDTYEVSEIVIPEQGRLSPRYFQRLFSYGGSSQLAREDFYRRLERLYATGYFSFLYYDVAQQSENCRHIRLCPTLKSGFDRRLRLGVHYDAVYRSSVLINLTQLSVPGLRNATASLDLIFGDKVRYNFNLLVDGGALPDLGFNSRLRYNTLEYLLPQPIRADSNLLLERLRINLVDVYNQCYVQLLRNNDNAFGLYGALQFFNSSARDLQQYEGRAGLADEDAFYLDAGLFFIHDDRDHRDFAMDGTNIEAHGRFLYLLSRPDHRWQAQRPAYNLDVRFEGFVPLGRSVSAGASIDAGFLTGARTQPWLYVLGGYNRNFINNHRSFPGLLFGGDIGSALGSGAAYLRLTPLRRHFLTLSVHGALLRRDYRPPGIGLLGKYYSIAMAYGIDTFLGPVEILLTTGSEGATFYFNLGHWF